MPPTSGVEGNELHGGVLMISVTFHPQGSCACVVLQTTNSARLTPNAQAAMRPRFMRASFRGHPHEPYTPKTGQSCSIRVSRHALGTWRGRKTRPFRLSPEFF